MKNQFHSIDIIIPAYKAQDTILKTLSSIALQEIVDECEVTIVNDADGIGYKKFVDMFSPFMKIREIVMPKNGGPGDARQYGMDNTSNPYITFIDADDTFGNAFALRTLKNEIISNPHYVCVFSQFVEDNKHSFITHPDDSVWMFGKLYKRDFINKYGIKFLKGSRANEDCGFNMICKLLSNKKELIHYIPDVTYYWHYKEDSITRVNNAEYTYNQSFIGYVDNMIYALKFAEKVLPFNDFTSDKVTIFCNLYENWLETCKNDKRFQEQNYKCCVKYYTHIYKDIKDKVSTTLLEHCYYNAMKNFYMGNKMIGIIPHITFNEFICKIEREI